MFSLFAHWDSAPSRNFNTIPEPRHTSNLTFHSQRDSTRVIEKRLVTELSTCGYLNGDPKLSRTANSGYDCRVDTIHALWGFCPTTVIAATDCGLAAACIDSFSCSKGCGYTTDPSLTTWTCGEGDQPAFCSTALLTFGVDQTFTYLACGNTAKTDNYLVTPTVTTSVSVSISAVTITRSEVPSTTTSSTSSLFSISGVTITTSEALSTTVSSTSSLTPEFSKSSSTTTISATPSPSSPEQQSPTSSNTGAIIGGVLGGLALICASVLLAIYLLRRDRSRKQRDELGRGRDLVQRVVSPVEFKDTRHHGGWGPWELPASYPDPTIQLHSPVELPGYDVRR